MPFVGTPTIRLQLQLRSDFVLLVTYWIAVGEGQGRETDSLSWSQKIEEDARCDDG